MGGISRRLTVLFFITGVCSNIMGFIAGNAFLQILINPLLPENLS